MNVDIAIGCDHAGFDLKQKVVKLLQHKGHKVFDMGTNDTSSVDYPDFADSVCKWLENEVRQSPGFGILICGSGEGMVMRANRYPHVRAALCWNVEVAQLSRSHNNANVLCLAARLVEESLNLQILEAFLHTEFAGGRHEGRVAKINKPI